MTSGQAIGYKELIDYINNKCSLEEAVEKIKQESRRYAKRQLTWFRKIENITWLNGLNSLEENIDIILNEIK